MDDSLVGRTPEEKAGVPLLENEGSVHKGIDILEHSGHFGIGLDLLYGETCPAPDVLVRLGLYAPCQLGKGSCLIERVAAAERDIGDAVRLYDFHQLVYAHPMAVVYIPGLGIMASRTVVTAAGTIYGSAQTGPVGHGLLHYVQNGYFIRERHGP